MSDFAGELKVLGLTEKGIKCSVVGDNAESFWLPRGGGHVVWRQEPEAGKTISVIVPEWLAEKHQQLGGESTNAKRDIAANHPH